MTERRYTEFQLNDEGHGHSSEFSQKIRLRCISTTDIRFHRSTTTPQMHSPLQRHGYDEYGYPAKTETESASVKDKTDSSKALLSAAPLAVLSKMHHTVAPLDLAR